MRGLVAFFTAKSQKSALEGLKSSRRVDLKKSGGGADLSVRVRSRLLQMARPQQVIVTGGTKMIAALLRALWRVSTYEKDTELQDRSEGD